MYGLVFLFKWQASLASTREPTEAPEVYFAKQVISNACATQALLAILMNQSDDDLDVGEQLKNLRVCSPSSTPEATAPPEHSDRHLPCRTSQPTSQRI